MDSWLLEHQGGSADEIVTLRVQGRARQGNGNSRNGKSGRWLRGRPRLRTGCVNLGADSGKVVTGWNSHMWGLFCQLLQCNVTYSNVHGNTHLNISVTPWNEHRQTERQQFIFRYIRLNSRAGVCQTPLVPKTTTLHWHFCARDSLRSTQERAEERTCKNTERCRCGVWNGLYAFRSVQNLRSGLRNFYARACFS